MQVTLPPPLYPTLPARTRVTWLWAQRPGQFTKPPLHCAEHLHCCSLLACKLAAQNGGMTVMSSTASTNTKLLIAVCYFPARLVPSLPSLL